MKSETVKIGNKEITLETGKIAKQANGSVIVKQGDSVVLVTAVSASEPNEGVDFFPLTVEYQEKASAVGRIPAGFIKREGKASDHEILSCRLIDRSIRPLFPKDFLCETQIISTVFSADPKAEPEILSIIGASLALHISDIPWDGPVAGVRIVRVNKRLIPFPTLEEQEIADLNIVVSVGFDGLVMIEGKISELEEEDVLEAIFYAQEVLHPLLHLMERWKNEIGIPKKEIAVSCLDEELSKKVKELSEDKIKKAVKISAKQERRRKIDEIIKEVVKEVSIDKNDCKLEVTKIINELQHDIIRKMIVEEGIRIDGRTPEKIRPIWGEVGWLPRAHGSAIFSRGETQALVTCTLGTSSDEQILDTLFGEKKERFMLHYNFLPYSVGEVRGLRGPGRREIGHGNLAKRALEQVLPSVEKFPYSIRVVSDISESNGSSSMATVCGGALALMDAGVPIKHVAGIAMGLIQENEKIIILSDILGDEDHVGDMDFKVAGTEKGITALQMDNKVKSLSQEVLKKALEQAKQGRLHILEEMKKIITASKPSLSPYAPRVVSLKIRKERIKDLIGPGGKIIQEIQELTGTKIEIDNEGFVKIYSNDSSMLSKSLKLIKNYVGELEVGKIYKGVVTSLKDFGAFVKIYSNIEGLIHISEIDNERVNKVSEILKEGDEILVKVLGVDNQGKIRLSRKAALNVSFDEAEN